MYGRLRLRCLHRCNRYEYFGHYFFSSDRVFVVLAPPTQLRHPASDQMLALLLAQDPHAV